MRAHRVEVSSPALDDDLRFPQGVEDLAVEELVPKTRIEGLDIPVLPRRARSDVGGLGADRRDPLLHRFGHELGAIVGPYVARDPRRMNRSESTSMTSIALSVRSTRMARHSWVNSSMTLSMRNFRPLWVRSSTKSYDQT